MYFRPHQLRPVWFGWEEGNLAVRYHEIKFVDFTLDGTTGLSVHPDLTLGLDVLGLIAYLGVPYEMREGDVYSQGLVLFTGKDQVANSQLYRAYSDDWDWNWTKIKDANEGLKLDWSKVPPGAWFESFINLFASLVYCVIPGIGPFLSITFDLAIAITQNPPNANDTIKKKISNANIDPKLL